MLTIRLRRPLAASLVSIATLLSATLPPVHIHLAEHDDHDHPHGTTVEHSHWAGHHSSGAAFDDDDGRVMFVDRVAVASSVVDATIARPATALIARFILPAPSTFTVAARPTSGNSPRDGPARGTTLLRAPPAFVTL